MPHKFNGRCRHKFAKKRYRVTNWREYNDSLRGRGDLTIWITGDAQQKWAAARRKSRGGQPRYSDLAIAMCLTIGMVYKLPLRQTQGLMRSISKLMQLEVFVPDFSTLSRRGHGLFLPATPKAKRTDPVHLTIDSTGLKIFGEDEWLENKHKTKAKRKKWRKLHIGLDLVTGKIICSDLTKDNVADTTALPRLLDQIDTPVSHFLAPSRQIALQSPAGQWMALTTARPPIPCSGRDLATGLRSLFHHQRMPRLARNLSMIQHSGINASLKYRPVGAWLGNPTAAIISAAELKPRSAAGKLSSGRN